MIANVYHCPHCGTDVYLKQDETYCPICRKSELNDMELVRLNVDLEEDAKNESPEFAHIGHLAEMLRLAFDDKSGLYLMDCWEYAWDASKTDNENLDALEAFIENPNRFVSKYKEPMDFDTLKSEIERLLNLALSKAKMPQDLDDIENFMFSDVDYNPEIRIFINRDLTDISASACYKRGLDIYEGTFVPVERNYFPPFNTKNHHMFVFYYNGRITTRATRMKQLPIDVSRAAKKIADIFYPEHWKTESFFKRLFAKEPKHLYVQLNKSVLCENQK